jgi:hypothetical protein
MKKIILFLLLFLCLLAGLFFYSSTHEKAVQRKTVLSASKKRSSISHVFVIVMENTNWSTLKDNRSAPYINSLLHSSQVSYATQYYALHHPSEPNYVWMEAGEANNLPHDKKKINLITDGDPTDTNSTTTNDHLVTLLEKKGLSWKVYAEGIDGTNCPMMSSDSSHFAARHIPMLFFQDITNDEKNCMRHIRPFSELETDISHNTVSNYSFIVPDLCNSMHDIYNCQSFNRIKNGDDWLTKTIPLIQKSPIFTTSTIFLTWDEGSGESTSPIGMIVLSPFAKGNGYHNTIPYTHSSLLRTVQDIFSLTPFLRDAKNAEGLNDLFINL